MCGIEVTNSARKERAILKQVVKYLNENNETIIKDIIFLLETDQEKSYIDDLKENKENFIESIKGDFSYMEDYAKTPNTRNKKLNKDDPKYKNIYIVSSLKLAYCDFYQEFSKQIEILKKGKDVKSRLNKLSTALQKKYKCK